MKAFRISQCPSLLSTTSFRQLSTRAPQVSKALDPNTTQEPNQHTTSSHNPPQRPNSAHLQRTSHSPTITSTGQFRNKKVLVTGASRGIGAAISRRFATEGARCLLVGRREDLLKKVQSELKGEEHEVRLGDVGDRDFWRGLRGEKNIDVLVNAAGIAHYSPLAATTPELLDEVVRINLMGTMLGCRTVGKIMMSNPHGGCIINIASLLGLKGGAGSVGYAASKAGVIGLTRSLAAELGPRGVRVNVIIPGYIETDMTEAMTLQARNDAINTVPMRRFGHTSEVADSAIFLAANTYATNCMLNLDGGLSAV